MYCPKCGTENPDNAQVCRACSWILTDAAKAASAPGSRTSGLAIASLVLAILSPFTCILTAIPAIILGIVALVKINQSQGQLKGNGLAIAGIAVPVAALPIIAMLMGILMPALARVRQASFKMVCATNMSALSKAMLFYANDYDDNFPTPSNWCDLLIKCADVSPSTFCCKGASGCRGRCCYKGVSDKLCCYAMNKNVQDLHARELPPDMVLLFETEPGWNQSGGPEILTTNNHQGEGCNVVFVDCHVQWIKKKDIDDLKWTPE